VGLGSLAEYKRELIKERTALKRAASRADGTKFAWPRKVCDGIRQGSPKSDWRAGINATTPG